MPIFSFRTIQRPSDSIYKEKGSRFLAFSYPVQSEIEIKQALEGLRKQYFDARHHCFAWILGPEKKQFRAFDDGEPNHSAGDPILGQLRSRDLTNVLVVVVRYFGGTKLGVGGLISAYRIAAAEALDKAEIIEKEVTGTLVLRFNYNATPEVMKAVKDFDLTILRQNYADDCELEVELKLRIRTSLMEKLSLLKSLGTDLRINE